MSADAVAVARARPMLEIRVPKLLLEGIRGFPSSQDQQDPRRAVARDLESGVPPHSDPLGLDFVAGTSNSEKIARIGLQPGPDRNTMGLWVPAHATFPFPLFPT